MRFPFVIACTLLCGLGQAAQLDVMDPRELLANVRRHVMETVDRLPKYMCTETIERFRYATEYRRHLPSCDEPSRTDPPAKLSLTASDRLRVDVAIAPTREIYSWPGADRFDDRDLLDVVNEGAISTGEFAGFLSNIFGSTVATFTYNGDHKDEKGREVAEFGYTVAPDKSKHQFGNKRYRAFTGYDGSFLVDPQSFDLVQLTLRTSRLPEESGSCDATTTLTYQRVHLNDAEFLLPAEASFRVIGLDGNESHNRAAYSACHEFHADSKISFDALAPTGAAAISPPEQPLSIPPLDLHAGLPFRLKLEQDIDSAAAAAGDPVKAVVSSAIVDRDSKAVVPVGTVVHGRIIRIQRNYGARPSLTVAIRLETIEALGKARPFRAKGESPIKRFNAGVVSFTRQRVELGSLESAESGDTAELFLLNPPANHVFPRGTEMKWITLGHRTAATHP